MARLDDALCPTLPGPHSSCVYSLKLIPPDFLHFLRAFAYAMRCFARLSIVKVSRLRLQTLRCSCIPTLCTQYEHVWLWVAHFCTFLMGACCTSG